MRVVDLFCGCGGASAGFARAGATIILAVDSDPVQLAHHRLNHPCARHVCRVLGNDDDDPVAFARRLNAAVGGDYHLHASPPCKNYSHLNRQSDTGNNDLVRWVAAVILAAKPRTWSVENVPRALLPFRETVPDLFAVDGVRVFDKVLGWHYGAPVLRRRLFFGVGFDLSVPPVIDPTRVSLRAALPYLTADHYVRDPATNVDVPRRRDRDRGRPARRPATRGDPTRGQLLRTVHLPTYAPRASGRDQLWVADGRGGYRSDRVLTVREIATIQGFDADWSIPTRLSRERVFFYHDVVGDAGTVHEVRHTKRSVTTGVGNSVCVPVAAEIARQAAAAHACATRSAVSAGSGNACAPCARTAAVTASTEA